MLCRAAGENLLRCLHTARPTRPRFLTPRRIHTPAMQSASRFHGNLIKTGATTDTYTWNNILTAYARCGGGRGLIEACKVFEEIPQRDTVSWNSMIASYVYCVQFENAWDLLKSMMRSGLVFDQYTFGSILKSVASAAHVELGRKLHSLIVKAGLDMNVFSGTALVDMYAKCGRIVDADLAFRLMPFHNAASWNALIGGHAQARDRTAVFELFHCMEKEEDISPDEATFASVLTLLDEPMLYNAACQVHAKIIKRGWELDTVACNAAITAYSQCNSVEDARKVFHFMEVNRDLVSWNSMLAAYACDGLAGSAVEFFVRMQELGMEMDIYTYTSVISACYEQGLHGQGRAFHGLVVKCGMESRVPISNTLIAMYIKSSDTCAMEDAVACFDSMLCRDNVSWNSILTGFSQSGLSEEAVKFFCRMQSACLKIDQYALSAALRSCSDLAVLLLGRQFHGLVVKSGFGLNNFVVSSLIYMYSKSGVIDNASRTFDDSLKDSSVTWNSIIFAYAQHGRGHFALDLFVEMQELDVKPDHITFVGILSACSHAGLVEEGKRFLESIEPIYGIPLRMEHYACGVDLFGRAGRLDAAEDLIDSMPFEPDTMVWLTLLGACRIHGDIKLASHVARHLLILEPEEHSTYVLLSNVYAGFKKYDDRAMIQRTMRDRGVCKVPGCSWIEVKNRVHAFNAEDRSHPRAEDIYQRLGDLMEDMGRPSFIPDVEFTLHDLDSG